MKYKVKKSSLSGKVDASPSKSHSLRAVLFASMAWGKSAIKHYLKSPDLTAMVDACRMLGAKIEVLPDLIIVDGTAGKMNTPDNVINAGNSGQVLRFITAILSLNSTYSVITGDASIRYRRPMQSLMNGLKGLGAACLSTKNDGYAPIIVRGPIMPGVTELEGNDSQPVSALLMATAFLEGKSEIIVKDAGEKPWIDLTISWLDKIGVHCKNYNYERYMVFGGEKYRGFEYLVPGDFSSILFPVVAALITGSEIDVKYVDMNDAQGDKKVIAVLKAMGANIEYDSCQKILKVRKTKELIGMEIDVNDFIDSVPILAVLGCFAKGETKLINAEIARSKECDRLTGITKELRNMGAIIDEFKDTLVIKSTELHGADVKTYNDHRMVMALTVAGMAAKGKTVVDDIQSVAKSYPGFCEDMKNLGAKISVII